VKHPVTPDGRDFVVRGTARHSPLAPLGWLIAVVIEAGRGLLLLLGFRGRPVDFVVALFNLATAVIFHRNFADQNQMIHFLKNVMLVGGLLQIVHCGAGAFSLDARRAAPSPALRRGEGHP
jgi:putative oxidoreductase